MFKWEPRKNFVFQLEVDDVEHVCEILRSIGICKLVDFTPISFFFCQLILAHPNNGYMGLIIRVYMKFL